MSVAVRAYEATCLDLHRLQQQEQRDATGQQSAAISESCEGMGAVSMSVGGGMVESCAMESGGGNRGAGKEGAATAVRWVHGHHVGGYVAITRLGTWPSRGWVRGHHTGGYVAITWVGTWPSRGWDRELWKRGRGGTGK